MIRRRCPHRLTAWTRLTSGRWHDPLVGRDVLLGTLFGVPATVYYSTIPFFPSRMGPAVVHTGFLHPLGQLAGHATVAVGSTWLYAGLFAVLLVIARREWIATGIVGALLLVPVLFGSEAPRLLQAFSVVLVAAGLSLFLRLGMVSVVAFFFAATVSQNCPLTLDTTAWYFSASLTYLVALVLLAGYAAWTAPGGQPLWHDAWAADD